MTITIIPNRLAGVDIPQLYHLIRKNEPNLVRCNPKLSEVILEMKSCPLQEYGIIGTEASRFNLSEDDQTLRLWVVCPEESDAAEMSREVELQIEAVRQVAWVWAWASPNISKKATASYNTRH
jgi:hypothetical protein